MAMIMMGDSTRKGKAMQAKDNATNLINLLRKNNSTLMDSIINGVHNKETFNISLDMMRTLYTTVGEVTNDTQEEINHLHKVQARREKIEEIVELKKALYQEVTKSMTILNILRKDNPSQEDIDWCSEVQYLNNFTATSKEILNLSTLLVNAETKKDADHIIYLMKDALNNL